MVKKTIQYILITILATFALVGCGQLEPQPIDTEQEDIDREQTMCPAIYAPVCGVDGITYSNDCVANAENVEIAYQGECNENDEDIEPIDCTTEYFPVCGVDGNTYGNECEARNSGVEIAHPGECIKDTNDERPIACTREYAPVCGVDGITYSNDCVANAENVEIAYRGECSEENQDSNVQISYANGIVTYSIPVMKPTPCHTVEKEITVLERYPPAMHIRLETIDSGEMCIQVISEEVISGSYDIETRPDSVSIFLNNDLIYMTSDY